MVGHIAGRALPVREVGTLSTHNGTMPCGIFVWLRRHRRGNTLLLLTVAMEGSAAAPPEQKKQMKP